MTFTEFKFYLLLPLIVALAWFWPRFGKSWRLATERWLGRVGRHRWKAMILVGLTNFLLCAIPGLIYPPVPEAHDEFCYLLSADTFLHGRLTNPTPPMWEHFESVHVILHPTYNAKYPPGQGAALALGGLLWRPILGVWITVALACAAVCWMLQAWLPPRWALVGGLLVAAHPLILQWSYEYWGGAVAMLGGALVCGGLRRILQKDRWAGWPLAIGLILLANSRPYEGLVLSGVMIVGTVYLGVREKQEKLRALAGRLLPSLVIAAIVILSFSTYYNFRVTGNPLRMPYVEHRLQYGIVPLFAWQKFRPVPAYRHAVLRAMYLYENELCWGHSGFLGGVELKLAAQIRGWWWKGLWLPLLLAVPAGWRWSAWFRMAAAALGIFLLAILTSAGIFPHYAAPAGGLLIFVAMACLRQLRTWQRARGVGRAFVWWLCVLSVATVPLIWKRMVDANVVGWWRERERIADELAAKPGPQLVIVRYAADHNPNWEWVYNGAEIEHAKTLWARAMAVESDAELVAHFPNRAVWWLDADEPHPQLVPYDGAAAK